MTEIQPGYKQTEVGVIPEDWMVQSLGDLLVGIPSYGINAPATSYDLRYPTYLRITDISEDGRFLDESKASVKHPLASNYILSEGDLVLARTGASVGKSYLYDCRDGELIFAGFLIRVRPDSKKLESKYLKYFTHSRPYWNWVKVNSMRSGQPGINGREYASLLIPLPPTKAEQEAIAEALSDTDALIESLEQLITKKRHLKQGTMQQLLTGKKRLPGFSGEWEIKKLGEIAEIRDGTHQTPKYVESGVPFFSVENVTSGDFTNTKFISETEHRFLTKTFKIEIGDILMTRIGSIGDCKLIDWEVDASFYVSLALLKIRKSYSSSFICHYSNSAIFKKEVELNSLQSAIPRKINLGPISNVCIEIPKDINEQTAIATILSDMDTGIATLETKLAKTRSLKQGMMHNLLTGRIRLV